MLPDSFIDVVKLIYHHFRAKRLEKRIARKNNRTVASILSSGKLIQLELGSPRRPGMDNWTFVDMEENSDVQMDLSRPLPFPDGSVAKIYSSHLFEHLSYPKPMVDLMRESYRVLKCEGVFSIAVPNGRIYLNAYAYPELFDRAKFCLYDTGLTYKSKIDYVNYMAYMSGYHHHLFDEESLLVILSDAGFDDVHLRQFDPSLDLEGRRYETIYAEGRK